MRTQESFPVDCHGDHRSRDLLLCHGALCRRWNRWWWDRCLAHHRFLLLHDQARGRTVQLLDLDQLDHAIWIQLEIQEPILGQARHGPH